jgi:hypothetical protein
MEDELIADEDVVGLLKEFPVYHCCPASSKVAGHVVGKLGGCPGKERLTLATVMTLSLPVLPSSYTGHVGKERREAVGGSGTAAK